jgi:hypothetical protein
MPTDAPLTGIPRSCHSAPPQVVALTGGFLLDITLHSTEANAKPAVVDDLVWKGLSHTTRRGHQLALQQLKELVKSALPWRKEQPLTRVILDYLRDKKEARKWLDQTMFREATKLHGAFSSLPIYSNWPHAIQLLDDPHWCAALRSLKEASNVAQPMGQTAARLEHILEALEQEPSLPVRVALILMWSTTNRVGCIRQLSPKDIRFGRKLPSGEEEVTVQITKGKGVKARGTLYTVPTALRPEWAAQVRELMASIPDPSQPLFPERIQVDDRTLPMDACMLTAIRRADEALCMKAIRRGALQALAFALGQKGTARHEALEQLKVFSGHTNDRMVLRYLDWGLQFHSDLQSGASVAAAGLLVPQL